MNAERAPASVDDGWEGAGFDEDETAAWRAAGWSEPAEAARWHRSCPRTGPESLRKLRDAGYSPDQPAHVAHIVDDSLVAWTRALAGDAPGDPESHQAREATARYALELVSSTAALTTRWEHPADRSPEREPQRA